MSGITLAVNLAISIAIILFLVLKFKINPVISMILASLYMGYPAAWASWTPLHQSTADLDL